MAKWRYAENKLHNTYNITWWAGDRFYEAQELLQEREARLAEPVIKKPKRITRPKGKRKKAQQSEIKAEAVPEPKTEETSKADLEERQDKEPKP